MSKIKNIYAQVEITEEKPSREDIDQMKAKIFSFVKERGGGATYVELERIPGFEGEYIHGNSTYNVVFWMRLSLPALFAMQELINEDKIISVATNRTYLAYLVDGKLLDLPVVKNFSWLESGKKYTNTRWLPLVFDIGKEQE